MRRAILTFVLIALTCPAFAAIEPPAPKDDLRTVVRDAARQAERAHILEALRQTSGNRVKAARLLKISRASLYNKLHEFDIQ